MIIYSASEGFTSRLPLNTQKGDLELYAYASNNYAFLLNTSEFRNKKITYAQWADLCDAYSQHPRTKEVTAALRRINQLILDYDAKKANSQKGDKDNG